MCDCVDIEIGSYDNQSELDRPDHMINRKEGTSSDTICVDSCLVDEIKDLWDQGIITTGCCCGHNKTYSYIGVIEDHIHEMMEMGYEVRFNPMRPDDNDSFIPKSI